MVLPLRLWLRTEHPQHWHCQVSPHRSQTHHPPSSPVHQAAPRGHESNITGIFISTADAVPQRRYVEAKIPELT